MRIYAIDNTLNSNNLQKINNKNNISDRHTLSNTNNQISFKSAEGAVIYWVARSGYELLNGTVEKAAYKRKLCEKIIDTERVKAKGDGYVDTIFALAKTHPSAEPKFNLFYLIEDFEFHSFTLKKIKNYAMKCFFPLTRECKEDSNFAHAAKVAFLRSMIDTGEYIDSEYFYKTFTDLPPEYDRDKESLAAQILKDKNARDNYISLNSRKNPDVLTYKKYIADTALIRSMPVERHSEFFKNYANSIDSLYSYSFPYIIKMLTNRTENGGQYAPIADDKNLFFGFYKNGFVHEDYDYLINNQNYYKTLYPNGFDVYTQALFCDAFFNLMESYKDNPEEGANAINVEPFMFDDMKKDYETIIKASQMKNEQEQLELFKARITEKENSGSYEIMDSVPGFIYLTGKADKLEESKECDPITKTNLDALVNNAPNYKYDNFDALGIDHLRAIVYNIRAEQERINNLPYSERADLETPWNVP